MSKFITTAWQNYKRRNPNLNYHFRLLKPVPEGSIKTIPITENTKATGNLQKLQKAEC